MTATHHDALRQQARGYYEDRLRAHGATPAGMDWNSLASQELRFQQLARLWETEPDATVLDYGCGYAALATYLRTRGHRGAYAGYDVSEEMIAAARTHAAGLTGVTLTARHEALTPHDYAVASGVLNVKQQAGTDEWSAYVRETIADLARLGTRGFAFNALTRYSDADKQRPDLYYADPLELFDHCARTYSRSVALLHDYRLYEFTILVRQTAPPKAGPLDTAVGGAEPQCRPSEAEPR